MGMIVCGVDGSQEADRALSWARRQALLTGSRLRAVICWEVPTTTMISPIGLPDDLDFGADARATLLRAVQGTDGGPDTKVEIEQLVVEGHPAVALMAEATGADLLVVGSKGHGEFAGMLLGSVSLHAATHAPCPVVIVRPAPPAP